MVRVGFGEGASKVTIKTIKIIKTIKNIKTIEIIKTFQLIASMFRPDKAPKLLGSCVSDPRLTEA